MKKEKYRNYNYYYGVDNLKKVSDKLSKVMKVKLSEADYYDWLEGGENFNKFDEVVRNYLGEELYNNTDFYARLDKVLKIKLGLLK